MPLWPTKPKAQVKTGNNTEPIALDGGINRDGTIFNIKPNEAWDSQNTSGEITGALTIKNTDDLLFYKLSGGTNMISSIFGFGIGTAKTTAVNKYLHLLVINPDDATQSKIILYNPVDDTYQGIEFPDLNSNPTTILTFITADHNYTIYASEYGVYEQHEGTLTEITGAPKTPIYCIDDNRLYALRYTTLWWSDINNPTNWTSGDFGKDILVDFAGFGTALVTLNDIVIAFSTTSMCFIYGDDTGNFQQSSQSMPHGCVGNLAVDKTEDAIFFLDYGALKVYSSGRVDDISKKISYWLKGMNTNFDLGKHPAAVAVNGRHVYLSIPYGESTYNNITFQYDLDSGNWYRWSTGYSHFLRYGKDFYGIITTTSVAGVKSIAKIASNPTSTTTSWYHETPMKFMGFNKQTISSIPILFNLPTGSTMKLQYNTNPNTPDWKDLYIFTPSANMQNQKVDVPMTVLNNVDMYQLKLSGTGPCTVIYLGEDKRVRVR